MGMTSKAGGSKPQATEVEVAGRTVRLTSPDKVYFPQRGYTKRDVFEYYLSVGDGILRALRERPTTLQRFPEGIEGEMFYQKRIPTRGVPPWIHSAEIAFPSGRTAHELCPVDLAHVAWAAQMGAVDPTSKPLRGFGGASVMEIVVPFRSDAYRAVYTVQLQNAVYVLHAFQKKSKRGVATPQADMELIRKRLADARVEDARKLP